MKSKTGTPDSATSPTAHTWVTRGKDGALTRVRVRDMTDQHLWRWIRYFRRRWREERGFQGEDADLDSIIKMSIVTAPAIYAEAYKRQVIPGLAPPPAPVVVEPLKPIFMGTVNLGGPSPAATAMQMIDMANSAAKKAKTKTKKHAAPPEPEYAPGVRKITLDED